MPHERTIENMWTEVTLNFFLTLIAFTYSSADTIYSILYCAGNVVVMWGK